jgi:hypothetical protein
MPSGRRWVPVRRRHDETQALASITVCSQVLLVPRAATGPVRHVLLSALRAGRGRVASFLAMKGTMAELTVGQARKYLFVERKTDSMGRQYTVRMPLQTEEYGSRCLALDALAASLEDQRERWLAAHPDDEPYWDKETDAMTKEELMDEMTVGDYNNGTWRECPYAFEQEAINKLADKVQDQRVRYLAANPDQPDDFKPIEQCTKEELLAELNSVEFRSAG